MTPGKWVARGPLPVGQGGAVASERIVAVARAESAPVQRAMRRAAKAGLLVDLTFGRRVRAVVFMDSGHLVRVAISPETLQGRWAEIGQGAHPCGEKSSPPN
jgi:hypothetical protein